MEGLRHLSSEWGCRRAECSGCGWETVHPLIEFITDLSNSDLCLFDLFLEVNVAGLSFLVLFGLLQFLSMTVELSVTSAKPFNETLSVLFAFLVAELH